MADVETPMDFEAIQQLLEAGDLDSVRDILEGTDPNDEAYAVLRLRLALMDGSVTPTIATQRLIQLMRGQPNFPGARALFQEASKLAYSEGQSSVSHSHLPPPVKTK